MEKSDADNHRIYKSVFVDLVKKDGTKKSRFCVAVYNDKEHQLFTAAPTLLRKSLRLLIALCAMLEMPLKTRCETSVHTSYDKAKKACVRDSTARDELSWKVVEDFKTTLRYAGVPDSLVQNFHSSSYGQDEYDSSAHGSLPTLF